MAKQITESADDRGRAPNGRSSIFYSESDHKWHGWVTMGVKSNGKPDRRHRVADTEAKVTDKVRKLEAKRDKGDVLTKPGRAPTVEQWMTTYLDTIAIHKLKPRSYDDYWSKTRNWVIPHLGKHRLDRLLPEHLDAMYAAMYAVGRSTTTALKVHRMLSRALKVAVRRGKVGHNVCTLIDPPSMTEIEIEPLTQEEARRILDVTNGRRNGARWSVGLALGLRQGEALGLRWKYVDLKAGTVKVWWQLSRANWRHGCDDPHACGAKYHRAACPKKCAKHKHGADCAPDCENKKHTCPKPCARDCRKHADKCPKRHTGGLAFQEPKGKNKRTVTLPPELIPILRRHRAAQKREKLAAGDRWEDNDLVFCREDGRAIARNDDWHDWKDVLNAAGVRDARVHDGRHTAGTLLVEQGVHIRTVQEILGHRSVNTTERYVHVASPMAQAAAQSMGAALWGTGS